MQMTQQRDKLVTKDGWLTCPNCHRNHKLLRIDKDTVASGLPVYCRDCKTEIILDIERGRSVKRRSP